jgi:hypothetical protein
MGVHVKASLVKVAHKGNAFRKAHTLQTPPTGPVEELLFPGRRAQANPGVTLEARRVSSSPAAFRHFCPGS